MIVVAIIAILAAVAIPNFIKYRRSSQATACVSNLKQIQAAKEQSLMAGKGLTEADLYGASGYIKVTPTCPAGGSYTIGNATTDPTCNYSDTDASDTSTWHSLDRSTSGGGEG